MAKQFPFYGILSHQVQFNPGVLQIFTYLVFMLKFCTLDNLLTNETGQSPLQTSTTGIESMLDTVMGHHSLVT